MEVFIQRIVTQSLKFQEPIVPGLSVYSVYYIGLKINHFRHKCIEAIEEYDFLRETAGTFMTGLPADTPSGNLMRAAARLSISSEDGARRSSRRPSEKPEIAVSVERKPSDLVVDAAASEVMEPNGSEDSSQLSEHVPMDIAADTSGTKDSSLEKQEGDVKLDEVKGAV